MKEQDFEEIDSKPPAYASPTPKRKLDRQAPVSKHRDSTSRIQRSHTFSTGSGEDEIDDCVYTKKSSRDTSHLIEERKKKYIMSRRKTMHGDSVTSTQCQCRSHTGALRKCRCNLSRQTSNPSVSESELMKHETKLIVLEFLQNLRPEELTARSKESSSVDFNSLESIGVSEGYHSPDVLAEINEFKQYKEEYAETIEPDEIQKPVEKTISQKICHKADKPVVVKRRQIATVEEPHCPPKSVVEKTAATAIAPDNLETTSFQNRENENISANMSHPSKRLKGTVEKAERTNSVKYNTVAIGEYEHTQLLEMIKKHHEMNANEMTGGAKIGRSHSSITEEQYLVARNKIRDMQKPVEKWLDVHSTVQHKNLVKDIASFDKTKLKRKRNTYAQKKKTGLSLKIPKASVPPVDVSLDTDPEIFTPETQAVNKLELISEEIMLDCPEQLLSITKEMLKIVTKQDVNYDLFSKVAGSIYNLRTDDRKVTVWSRVAMVLYAVRETFYLGNLNDKQMELLVEYSTQFFSENAAQSVKEEGGWQGALGEDIFPANGMTYDFEDDDDDDDECLTHGPGCQSLRNNSTESESDDNTNNNNNDDENNSNVSEWTPYGVAALSVGLGLLYSYTKT